MKSAQGSCRLGETEQERGGEKNSVILQHVLGSVKVLTSSDLVTPALGRSPKEGGQNKEKRFRHKDVYCGDFYYNKVSE